MILLIPAIFFGIAFGVGWAVLALSERRLAIAQNVVRQITMVTTQNIPLATGLMLSGQGEPGKAGIILRRIASLIAAGLPLSEAVSQGYASSSGFVVSVIRAGERAGRLPAALKVLHDALDDQNRNRSKTLPMGFAYSLSYVFVVVLVWTGIMVVIVPKFKEIFSDFQAPLPGPMLALMATSDVLAHSPLGAMALLAALATGPICIHLTQRPRRPSRPRLTSVVADNVRWFIPGLRRLELARGMALIASLLRVFTSAGMELGRAARLTSETDMNVVLRDKFRGFVLLLETGTPPAAAAHQAGLGMIFATGLRAGQHGDGLDRSLKFVEEYYRALDSRFWIIVRSAAWPVMTIMLAILVGGLVTTLFLPLVRLIDSVMETI